MTYQRKPVQIAAAVRGDCIWLFALAQDGSMWAKAPSSATKWERIGELPEGGPCGAKADRPDNFACELIEGHAGVHYSSGLGAF